MNIQTINFCSRKKNGNNHTKYYPPQIQAGYQPSNETMVEEAQMAINQASKITKNSIVIQEEAKRHIADSEQIQQSTERILAEIVDTMEYMDFCISERIKEKTGKFSGKIKLRGKIYNFQINPQKITITLRTNTGTDVYEVDTNERKLIYCAKGIKKQGITTTIDEEYYFSANTLEKYQAKISLGNMNSIGQCFEYKPNRYNEHILSRYSSKISKTTDKTVAKEVFEFYDNEELKQYSKNSSKNATNEITKEEEYSFSFSDKHLKLFKKDFRKKADCCSSKLCVEYTSKNNFFVQANYNSTTTPEYSAICFYQNGNIEGSSVI